MFILLFFIFLIFQLRGTSIKNTLKFYSWKVKFMKFKYFTPSFIKKIKIKQWIIHPHYTRQLNVNQPSNAIRNISQHFNRTTRKPTSSKSKTHFKSNILHWQTVSLTRHTHITSMQFLLLSRGSCIMGL